MSTVKISTCQLPVTDNIAQNTREIQNAITQAQGSDYLLTPEGSVSGYFNACTFYNTAQDAQVEAHVQQLRDHALHERTGLVLGTCWRDERAMPRNSTRTWNSQGEFQTAYHKRLLTQTLWQTGDIACWMPGLAFDQGVWSDGDVRYSSLVCNDAWAQPGVSPQGNPYYIQELVTIYGVDVIFVAANCNETDYDPLFAQWIDVHLRAQAREWAVWIVTANSTLAPGGEGVDQLMLNAGIIAPTGEWFSRAEHNQPDVITETIHILPRNRTGNHSFYRPTDPTQPLEAD